MKLKLFFTTLFIVLGFHAGLMAQVTTGDIAGKVTSNGHPVEGAVVRAIHVPTSTVYGTTTRKDGRYNIPNVKVGGPYTIIASNVGSSEEKLENVYISLGQEYTADFGLKDVNMEIAGVTVAARRQDKNFNDNHEGSQEIINRSQIERLPTVNRSLQDFTRLTPSSNGLSFGGRSSSYNNITVDGANFNNAFGLSGTLGGQTSSQPISLDAIEQIQVSVSPFDVRQGGFSGAGVNTVTRSGTNEFKGTIYTYLRSPDMQGYILHTTQLVKPDFNYNLRGASAGGPIIKDKLFFFVSCEQERITKPATTYTANTPGGTAVPGAVSQVVADTLNALRNFLMTKYGYDPGSYQGYNYRTQSDKITARIDWNINSKNTFTVKYNYLKSLADIAASNSGAPNGNRQPSNYGLPFSGSGYTINNNFNIFIAELNTRFSNKASNKFQIGYSALRDFRTPLASGDFPLVDILNSTGQTMTSFGYEPFTYNNVLNSNIFQVSDVFTYYLGKHEITAGTQDYVKNFKNGFAPNYEGAYVFNSLADFYAGNAPKSYALQYSLTKDGSFPFAKIGVTELGVFVQDKWRVTSNFTVTAGLRADAPIFKNNFDQNPAVASLYFRDSARYDVGKAPNTNPIISPRIGFNWDAFKNHKTQIRGGFGSFAGPPPFVWISNQASNNGVQFGSYSYTTAAQIAANHIVFSPDINAYRPAATAANTSYNLVFTDPNFKYPTVLKATVGADQKMWWDIIGTIEYTYSHDINAVNFENVNLPATGVAFLGSDYRDRYSSTKINSGGTTPTEANPNITNAILMKNYNKGYGNVLTFQFQKSTKNVYASVAYTYSNTMSLNDGGSIAASTWRDRPVKGDPNAADLGYSNFYQPHHVIAQINYRKEYLQHFATSVGFIFEAAPAGVGSYVYQGDVNNDGTGGNNDLMYIPKDINDIVLVPVNTGGGTVTDTRTAAQQWNQLNNFINQDPYLNNHRGQIATRNAAVLPWYKHLDFNVTQDIYFKTPGVNSTKHTLRLSFDIINLGNLLNTNWGVAESFSNLAPLKYEGISPAGSATAGKPRYSFPYLDASNQIPYTKSYQDNTAIFSRWQAQLGIRYLFN